MACANHADVGGDLRQLRVRQIAHGLLRAAFYARRRGGWLCSWRDSLSDVLVSGCAPRQSVVTVLYGNSVGRHDRRPAVGLDHALASRHAKSLRLEVALRARSAAVARAGCRDPAVP